MRVTQVTGGEKKVYLHLANPILQNATVRVSYDPGLATDKEIVLEDWAGNRVGRFTDVEIRNSSLQTGTASAVPAPLRAYIGATDSSALTLQFDRAIQRTDFPEASAFSLTADGEEVTIHDVSRPRSRTNLVVLDLDVTEGEEARGLPKLLSYTKPTSGNVLKGTNSQEVPTFTNFIVHDPVTAFRLRINPLRLTVNEGNDPTADLTVRLEPSSTETVRVDYATTDDTAMAPGDYTETSGTLTFAPGKPSRR